ncbi:MAG: HAMP domain-containing histidine kinase [Lachnospiraceae bacterium]|nr:HAMP domain-containing histidine kinase [Lachnospiraceae bacterium]
MKKLISIFDKFKSFIKKIFTKIRKRLDEHKIRTKIMLWSFALSALLIIILIPTMYFGLVVSTKGSLSASMEDAIANVKESLYVDGDEIKLDMTKFNSEYLKNGIYIKVKDENGDLVYQSFDNGMGIKTEIGYEWLVQNSGSGWSEMSDGYYFQQRHVTIEAVGNVYLNKFYSHILLFVYILVPAYLILAAVGSRFLAAAALKPVAEITNAANDIKGGEWNRRIEVVNTRDEVGELSKTFNEMIEELEVSFKREKQFTSDASHELRTPVSVISACVDEAMMTENHDILMENLETIRTENKKMAKIISQLLTLSRGYEGKYNFEPEEIDLHDMVDSVAEVAGFEADAREITITNNIPEGTIVKADQSLFTQVLMNICGNAVKYGKDKGSIVIDFRKDDEFIWTVIRDDGIGISEEDINHIFERFFRADTARDRTGSGLGLSIVKWIMDLHKGKIEVDSVLGEGTEFRIGLPV